MAIQNYKFGDPIALIGMSGVGKTRIASMLRRDANWFHYSVDYRIGTRYLGEAIVDNFKREAMKTPLLRDLLKSDSIYISSNITFDNLDPLSTWLGKPGAPAKGGIPFTEYVKRQRLHSEGEIAAMKDVSLFINKAKDIYGYDHFICDASGSICEIVDPEDAADPVLKALSDHCLIVYIEEDDAYAEALKDRFNAAPKPMYYNEAFLKKSWADYLEETGAAEADVDPDAFIRWGFAKLIERRRPRYRAIADNWGVALPAASVEAATTPEAFLALVEKAATKR
ncbi:MAG: ATPase [Pseudomonadota bacterium]